MRPVGVLGSRKRGADLAAASSLEVHRIVPMVNGLTWWCCLWFWDGLGDLRGDVGAFANYRHGSLTSAIFNDGGSSLFSHFLKSSTRKMTLI